MDKDNKTMETIAVVKSIDISDFKCYANGHCKKSRYRPDNRSITRVILSTKRRLLEKENVVVIARYRWLSKRNLFLPDDMEIPNLCLMIKNKKLIRAFYSDTLNHVIKKLNYFIIILN